MAPAKVKKKKRQHNTEKPTEEAVAAVVPVEAARKKKKKKRLNVDAVVPKASEKAVVLHGQDNLVEEKGPKVMRKKKKRKLSSLDAEADSAAEVSTAKVAKKEFIEGVKAAVVAPKEVKAAEESTVFVDGVPYGWSVSQVEDLFRKCGQVTEVRAPTWQDSGRLRGFAHVTFASRAARDKALAMNGEQVDKKGRYLKIDPAKAPTAAEGPAAADLEGKRRLFVKNLPYDTTEQAINDLFSKCGKIREVRVPTSFGRCKGFAYVEFARAEHLKKAIAMQPPPSLQGRTLRLDADSGTGPKAGFHYRPEAFEAGFGPGRGRGGKDGDKGNGKGRGKGRGKGKGKGKGPEKLSLF